MNCQATFQNSNNNKTNNVIEVLKKTDDTIKNYVAFIVNSHPDKIDTLKKILERQKKSAAFEIEKCIVMVTNGLAGYSNSREEAIQKLKDWASGEMGKQIESTVLGIQEMTVEHGLSNLFNPNCIADMNSTMQPVGKSYLDYEETLRKTIMALAHLEIKLHEKNECSNTNVNINFK